MSQVSLKILVGSLNPVKVNASRSAFATLFPGAIIECHGMDAPSQVAEQPMTDVETRQGAINRMRFCQQTQAADYYLALEGGVDNFDYGPATFAYVAIGHGERVAIGRGAELPLPPQVYRALMAGEELGHVMDRLFDTVNIKQQGGAIGLLTHGHATRQSNYTHAILLAMAPLLNAELYSQ
jgi:inosine/xanthosine triphosphatase